jgi:hypothetical protein
MATIDSNIALGVKPLQVENPINQYAALSQIQSSQQANQLNALKMQEYERGLGEENKLRTLLGSGINLDSPEAIRQVYSISPKLGGEFEKNRQTIKKDVTDLEKTQTETAQKKLELIRQKTSDLQFNPSNENIIAHAQDGVLNKAWTQEQANQFVAASTAVPMTDRPKYFAQQGLNAEQRVVTSETEKNNAATRKIQQQNANTSSGQLTLAKQNQALQYGDDIVANTVTDAAGNVTQFNRKGQVIGTPGAVGKPSATFEKTAELKKQLGKNLDMAITNLDEITKDKGLIDQSTGSGAGRLYDTAQGFIGNATEGAIAIAKLKPIADMVLKMVPRFEGPQSDRDTTSYKEAAGQLANPDLPTAIRKAAGKEVLRIMKERKNQFVSETMSNEGLNASTNKAPPSGFVVDK